MSIYILCPDSNSPIGGVKVIYRHVDILNKYGYTAFVLHQKRNFRCTWFDNSTKIAYIRNSALRKVFSKAREMFTPIDVNEIPIKGGRSTRIGKDDYLVIPEKFGLDLAYIGKGIRKIILNQNGYLTFKGYSFAKSRRYTPYNNKDVLGVLVNSTHCQDYINYAFPQVTAYRFYLSIDPRMFSYSANKKKKICFSKIKNTYDAMQVINILKFRNALHDFEIYPFSKKSERDVAEILRESLIFLSLGNREGFGLPAAEAMACGCIVIGYHGGGGKEFFQPDLSFPVEDGDIVGFARTIEKVIEAYNQDSSCFSDMRKKASEFIRERYSPEREEQELVDIWNNICNGVSAVIPDKKSEEGFI
jgi:glycosyltransferase involved in cell wall biosynthesis